MPKRCGTIVLHEKMREPRKRIRNHDGGEHKPRPAKHDCSDQQAPSAQGADRMKNPSRQLLMRQDIKTPKFRERFRLVHGRDFILVLYARKKKMPLLRRLSGEVVASSHVDPHECKCLSAVRAAHYELSCSTERATITGCPVA